MITLPRQRKLRLSKFGIAMLSAAIVVGSLNTAFAAVTLTADPAYPGFPDVFTTDPTAFGTAQHNFVENRMLRQTFKNDEAFDIGQIILSLELDGVDAETNLGLKISIYEVDDVNGAAAEGNDDWSAALGANTTPIKTWDILPSEIPATNLRVGINFSGADVFNLPARNAGTTGYGLEVSILDPDGLMPTSFGGMFVTPANIDEYPDGVWYREDGSISRVERDFGLSILADGALPAVDGDVNNDREVDLDDFVVISNNFRNTVGSRLDGDLNADGMVDFQDFRIWKAAANPVSAAAAVPEPASWLLALVAMLFGGLRQRRLAPARALSASAASKGFAVVAVAAALMISLGTAQAAITFEVDPAYPPDPAGGTPLVDQFGVSGVFTVDPQLHSVAGRGIAGTRQLRQAFQVDETFYVGGITLAHAHGGTDGGYIISFYEVEDVNASPWNPIGNPLKVLTITNEVDVPSTSTTLGFVLTGSDSFTLEARGDVDGGDNTGYGIQIETFDKVSNNGNWLHSNDGTDNYTRGLYYTENGTPGATHRDFGLALTTTDIMPPGPGDVNEDLQVTLADLTLIRENFGKTPATRPEGDLSGNNLVFFEDFREWKNNYPPANPISAVSAEVPEPSSALLALLGLTTLAFQQRKRR